VIANPFVATVYSMLRQIAAGALRIVDHFFVDPGVEVEEDGEVDPGVDPCGEVDSPLNFGTKVFLSC